LCSFPVTFDSIALECRSLVSNSRHLALWPVNSTLSSSHTRHLTSVSLTFLICAQYLQGKTEHTVIVGHKSDPIASLLGQGFSFICLTRGRNNIEVSIKLYTDSP
jgi:hypothetical protein